MTEDDLADRLFHAAHQRDAAGEGSDAHAYFAAKAERLAVQLAQLEEADRFAAPSLSGRPSQWELTHRRHRERAQNLAKAATGFAATGLAILLVSAALGVGLPVVYVIGTFLLVTGGLCVGASGRAQRTASGLAAAEQVPMSQPATLAGFQSSSARSPDSAQERSSGGSIIPFRASSE